MVAYARSLSGIAVRDEAKEVRPRCEAAGPGKPEAYSLEYVEDFFRTSTTQLVVDHSPQ
jgi:hypothetical protein